MGDCPSVPQFFTFIFPISPSQEGFPMPLSILIYHQRPRAIACKWDLRCPALKLWQAELGWEEERHILALLQMVFCVTSSAVPDVVQ